MSVGTHEQLIVVLARGLLLAGTRKDFAAHHRLYLLLLEWTCASAYDERSLLEAAQEELAWLHLAHGDA